MAKNKRGSINAFSIINRNNNKKATDDTIANILGTNIEVNADEAKKAAQTESEKTEKILSKIHKEVSYGIVEIDKLDAAPKEWNYFSDPPNDVLLTMTASIMKIGLLQPIIVREMDNGRYQILAGHNRVKAYNTLYEYSHDEKYRTIEAKIYAKDVLTDDEAKTIIADTNFVQRNALPAKDKVTYICNKINELKNKNSDNDQTGTTIDGIAELIGMKRASIFLWKKLGSLHPALLQYLNDGKINLRVANLLASIPMEHQERLTLSPELINNKVIKSVLTPSMLKKVPSMDTNDLIGRFRIAIENEAKTVKTNAKIAYKMTQDFDGKNDIINIKVPHDSSIDNRIIVLNIPKRQIEAGALKSIKQYVMEASKNNA